MDPTSISEQFKRWSQQSEDFVKIIQALEEENKNLKLKILELETKETNGNNVCVDGQDAQTSDESKMCGSVLSKSSEGANPPLDEIRVKEEALDEFIRNNLQSETPSAEEDMEIDIKEEEVGYGQSKSKQDCDNSTHNPIPVDPLSTDQSSDNPIKHEIDRSIQRMFHSPDKVSNIESVSGNCGPDSELLLISSSYLTKKIICPNLVKPLPQVTRPGLRGQKKKQPHLTTRPAEKIQCKNCSSTFDTRFKLMKHNESGKCKAPFNCFNCAKSFGTERVFTNHLKTHVGEKKKQSMSVRIDKELAANRKRSLPAENKKGKPRGRPKKLRKVVETETVVCNDVVMPVVVGEIIDHPCVVEKSLKEEKILRIILSNLEKNDLLNARLVSHAWNDQSLKVLQKSKFTKFLNLMNIDLYIHFTKFSKPRQFILPFHLDIWMTGYPGINLMFNQDLPSQVDSLCQMFGPQCVSTLTLATDDTDWTEEDVPGIGWMKRLFEILVLISTGLETLDLTGLRFRNDFLKNQKITFPKLKKLICDTRYCESGGTVPSLAYISIIENSQNLEDLTLTHPCDLDSWPLNFNQLKSLSLRSLFKPQNILDKILSSSGPPVLRELSTGFNFFESRSAEDKIVVHNILNAISSTLKSLKFRGHVIPTNAEYVRYPKLPHLEHLGLEYDIGCPRRPDDENFNISPENFPSLKSIELPIGFISTSPTVQSEFPNLSKLTLRVRATDLPGRVDEPLEQLQKIYPAPSKLCLVNVGGHGFVNYVLYRIMKSNWYKNIQQIEMIGFDRDDLGGILDGLELSPRVDSEKWYLKLEESLKTEVKNSLKRIRMEFEETVGFSPPGSIILRRANQLDCQIK